MFTHILQKQSHFGNIYVVQREDAFSYKLRRQTKKTTRSTPTHQIDLIRPQLVHDAEAVEVGHRVVPDPVHDGHGTVHRQPQEQVQLLKLLSLLTAGATSSRPETRSACLEAREKQVKC